MDDIERSVKVLSEILSNDFNEKNIRRIIRVIVEAGYEISKCKLTVPVEKTDFFMKNDCFKMRELCKPNEAECCGWIYNLPVWVSYSKNSVEFSLPK